MNRLLLLAAVVLLALAWLAWGPILGDEPRELAEPPQATSHRVAEPSEPAALAPLEKPEQPPRPEDARRPVEAPVPSDQVQAAPPPPTAGPGELLVRVVDRDGAPVGNVPVELVLTSTMHGGQLGEKDEALSGPDGYAVLRDCAQELQAAFRPDEAPSFWTGAGLELGVRTKLPFAEDDDRSMVVWLEVEPPDGAAVELVLPPHGWIDLSFEPAIDAAGVPLLPEHVVVRRADSGFYPGWRQGVPLDIEHTPHRLGPFGLGWEVSLRLSRSRQIGSLGAETVLGPTAHGEVLSVSVRTAGARAVTARALLPGGEPLAGASLHLQLDSPRPSGGSTTFVSTDAGGRFATWLPQELEASELVVRRVADPLEHSARASLAPLLTDAPSADLGDLTLLPTKSPPRLVAGGQVADAAGAPIRHAWVSAYEVTSEGVADRPIDRTRTDAEGRFDLDSAEPLPSGTVEVWVQHEEYLATEGTRVAVGTSDLALRLVRGATLSFAIDAEPDMLHWTQLLVRLKGPQTSRRLALGELSSDRETGRQHFTGLLEGDYHLTVEIRKTSWVLHEAEGTLLAGGSLDLGPIDLTGMTQPLRLEVLDADGAPVADATFELRASDGRGYRSLSTWDDNELYCLVPAGVGELRLWSQEHGGATVTPGPEVVRVTLAE